MVNGHTYICREHTKKITNDVHTCQINSYIQDEGIRNRKNHMGRLFQAVINYLIRWLIPSYDCTAVNHWVEIL